MIRGITPIDGAFELMGLHQAQVLMRFIFLETLAGKVIFALGFMLSIKAGLDKGHFKPAFVFLMIFFSLWFLLVIPRAKAVDPVSAMERSGYKEMSTVDLLRKNGYGEVMVNPLLDGLSRTIDSLVTAVAAVFERGGDTRGYLASPFLLTKVSILTSGIVAQGITDAQLEERAVHFYQDHFWPAVRKLETARDGMWPGDPDVMDTYKEEGRAQWQSLREALYQACDQDKIFGKMFERFYDGKVDKDAVVRSLLMREIALKPARYTLMTYAAELEQRRAVPLDQGRYQGDVVIPQKIMGVLPFIQGGVLFLLWSTLPAFLALTFLTRKMAPLVVFMGVLFSIKAWTLIWVILDKISTVWFGIDQTWGGLALWQSPGLNMVTALLAALLPAGVTFITIRRFR
jgi:hypothetical protein